MEIFESELTKIIFLVWIRYSLFLSSVGLMIYIINYFSLKVNRVYKLCESWDYLSKMILFICNDAYVLSLLPANMWGVSDLDAVCNMVILMMLEDEFYLSSDLHLSEICHITIVFSFKLKKRCQFFLQDNLNIEYPYSHIFNRSSPDLGYCIMNVSLYHYNYIYIITFHSILKKKLPLMKPILHTWTFW